MGCQNSCGLFLFGWWVFSRTEVQPSITNSIGSFLQNVLLNRNHCTYFCYCAIVCARYYSETMHAQRNRWVGDESFSCKKWASLWLQYFKTISFIEEELLNISMAVCWNRFSVWFGSAAFDQFCTINGQVILGIPGNSRQWCIFQVFLEEFLLLLF